MWFKQYKGFQGGKPGIKKNSFNCYIWGSIRASLDLSTNSGLLEKGNFFFSATSIYYPVFKITWKENNTCLNSSLCILYQEFNFYSNFTENKLFICFHTILVWKQSKQVLAPNNYTDWEPCHSMPLKTQFQGDIKVKFVILRRNLKPVVLKTLITLYRLGTSDILWQHLWFYAPGWGGYQTWPLTWRAVVWPCLRQGSEHGFNFTTAAWIQCHSDVVVVAVSPELDEPPPSKKRHMKTKNLLSGDLIVSLVLSSLPTPSHSLKPFLKAVRLHPSPLETAPTLPWKCPSNQAFPTPKIPFVLEECPSQHIFTAPPGHSAMTAGIWHTHQEPSGRQTWWQCSFYSAQWHRA